MQRASRQRNSRTTSKDSTSGSSHRTTLRRTTQGDSVGVQRERATGPPHLAEGIAHLEAKLERAEQEQQQRASTSSASATSRQGNRRSARVASLSHRAPTNFSGRQDLLPSGFHRFESPAASDTSSLAETSVHRIGAGAQSTAPTTPLSARSESFGATPASVQAAIQSRKRKASDSYESRVTPAKTPRQTRRSLASAESAFAEQGPSSSLRLRRSLSSSMDTARGNTKETARAKKGRRSGGRSTATTTAGDCGTGHEDSMDLDLSIDASFAPDDSIARNTRSARKSRSSLVGAGKPAPQPRTEAICGARSSSSSRRSSGSRQSQSKTDDKRRKGRVLVEPASSSSDDVHADANAGDAGSDGGGRNAEDDDDDDHSESEDGECHHDEDDDDDDNDDEEVGGAAFDSAGTPFGIDLRAMAGLMTGLSGRFKGMLASLKDRSDPSVQLAVLQELAEVLSISSEDSLAGYFPTDAFVTELVAILKGPSLNSAFDNADVDEEPANAMAISAIADQEDNLERMLLAARCMANMIEALPYSAHSIVAQNAVPLLVSKLQAIDFIDLAEQVLQTLEKLSSDYPTAIVNGGGLAAMLQYIDFFNIHTQRTAMTAVSKCCRRVPVDQFSSVQDAIGHITSILGSSDLRLRESAARSIVGIVDSFRAPPDQLAQLVTLEVCDAIKAVLDEGASGTSSSRSVSMAVYTDLLRALATASKAAPQVTGLLLDNGISETLLSILTGAGNSPAVLSPEKRAGRDKQRRSSDANAASKMTLLQNLSDRPKEQIQEALSLVCELLPPLPRKGIFDGSSYKLSSPGSSKRPAKSAVGKSASDSSSTEGGSPSGSGLSAQVADSVQDSTLTLRSSMFDERKSSLLALCTLMLPALIDIHTSSVTPNIRTKAMSSILKMMAFASSDELDSLLDDVPMSSFVASVISGRDSQATLLGSLQIVELLLSKKPDIYRSLLQREGVMWEVKQLAKQSTKAGARGSLGGGDAADPAKPKPSASSSASWKSQSLGSHEQDFSPSLRTQILARARHIHAKYAVQGDGAIDADPTASALVDARKLAKNLLKAVVDEDDLDGPLKEVFALLQDSTHALSSFELLKSGLLGAFLAIAELNDGSEYGSRARRALEKASRDDREASGTLIERLQEILSRHEDFELLGLGSNLQTDDRRSRASILSRQLRLRLVPENPTEVPASCANLIVSIHAVAPFKSLSDFLRPKLALGAMAGGSSVSSKLSSVLAAFAEASAEQQRQAEAGSSSLPTGRESSGSAQGRLSGSAPNGNADPGRSLAEVLMEGLLQDEFQAFEDQEEEEIDVIERSISPPADGGIDGQTSADAGKKERSKRETPQKDKTAPRGSYADALQKNGGAFRIAFSVGDREVDLTETIFHAIYSKERGSASSFTPTSAFWQGVHTVKFKKVEGSVASAAGPLGSKSVVPVLPKSDKTVHLQAAQILKVLHGGVGKPDELDLAQLQAPATTSWFVNKKLTAKLNRQLDEPMIVASACLPDWALTLPAEYPFMFPFETRLKYLQSTGFGYARIILHWQTQQRSSESGRQEESFGFLSRLQRQKVRVSRRHMLSSAIKVFDTYASSDSILEVEYFDEVGTGLAPTLEFYSTVSKDFALQANGMWLGDAADANGDYVSAPHGLFPIPTKQNAKSGVRRLNLFRTLGVFVAKALVDSRLIQLNLSPPFVDRLLGRDVAVTLDTLKLVDPGLASSLQAMRELNSGDVDALELTFTLPSDPAFELLAGGSGKAVTAANMDEYIASVADAILGDGIAPIVDAFRTGFNRILSIDTLKIFSAVELVTLFGNAEEDWSEATLSSTVKPDHGYNMDSSAYRDLVSILAEFDTDQRCKFLQWLTGSPKLPIGGFKSLNPPFTVVKRPCDPPLKPDDYLPSAMSCALYCKIPDYSSRAVMKQRLLTAITEGADSFHLS